jgi:hypothetical protein
MSNEQLQEIDPQQQAIIASLIAQEQPGKGGDENEQALDAELAKLDPEALMELLRQAYKEDANANARVIRRVTDLLKTSGKEEEADKIIAEARSESWRDLLGQWLGPKAHELLADQTTVSALEGHVSKVLEGLAEKLPGLLSDIDKGDQQALQKLTEVLAQDGLQAAQEFLSNSETSKDILFWIGNWVDQNPGYVLAMAVLAGVGAIVADMDIPEIEQKFKLGKGFSGSAALDPGSLRNLTIESAKLNLQYMSGQFSITAGGEYSKEEGAKGNVAARYGSKQDYIEAHGAIDPEGNIVAGLRGAFEDGLLSAEGGLQQDFGKDEFSANVRVRYGDKEDNVETTAKLNGDGTVELGLGANYVDGLLSGNVNGSYKSKEEDPLSLNGNLRYGNDTNYLQLQSGLQGGQFNSTLNGQYQLDPNRTLDGSFEHKPDLTRLTLGQTNTFDGGSLRSYYQTGTEGPLSGYDLKLQQPGLDLNLGVQDKGIDGSLDKITAGLQYSPDDLVALTLKYGLEESGKQTGEASVKLGDEQHGGSVGVTHDGQDTRLSASYQRKWDNWEASASATANLTTGDIEQLSARLGMSGDEYRRFSIEFAHTAGDNKSRDELKLLYQTSISRFIIQSQASYAYERAGDQKSHQFGGSVVTGYQLNDRYIPYVGVAGDYNSTTGESFVRPRAGLQVGDLNVFVEPTKDWKGASFGIGIRF